MRQSLSVLLYGDFLRDRLAASYQRAFSELGHVVIPFNTRHLREFLAPWLHHRLGHRLTIRSLGLRRLGAITWNRRFVEVAMQQRPDFVLILNGDFLMPATLAEIRARKVPVFIFHADNPLPESTNNRPETLPCALQSDCYFIWSQVLVQRLKAAGAYHVQYLPFAWDAELFPYHPPSTKQEHDVVFIGGWDKKREDFLKPIAEKFNLKIWGPPYWATRTHPHSPLRRCWQGKEAVDCEVAEIISQSKIALNILRQQNLPDGTNMRTFEVPGCGGFALSTRTQGALDIFPEGQAGNYFKDVEECIAQIEWFLLADQERQQIATNAHALVQQSHRYTDRAQQILDIYAQL